MKAILTKADVQKAIAALKQSGRKATIAAVHAELDRRGSLTTLCRLKAEIDAESPEVAAVDSALELFREVWAQAVEVGRGESRAGRLQLEQTVAALSADNERLESELVETTNNAARLNARLEETMSALVREREETVRLGRELAGIQIMGSATRFYGADGRAI